MNPPISPALLIPLLVAVMAAAGWLSWRGSEGLPRNQRVRLLGLRLAALAAISVVLINPGRWVRPVESRPRPWLVLVDVSSSMAQKSGETTRAAGAAEYVSHFRESAGRSSLPVRVHPFDAGLGAALTEGDSLPLPEGSGSRILAAAAQAIGEANAAGETPAGVLLISDGRSTDAETEGDAEAFAVRARAGLTPVFAVVPGGGDPSPDLVLKVGRQAITVFAGQPARLPWVLESRGFDAVRQEVVLKDDSGAVVAMQPAEVPAGGSVGGVFEFPVPASGRWHLSTAVQSGETRPVNNRVAVNVRVLTARTRVFLAEGAPYWDSKFLAQLLRQQSHMEVQSVHRLSDQRYFRINSGDLEPTGTSEALFPETPAEMARFDLIVFGRNTDSFLTTSRTEALRAFVRDQGGAVLFARGRATSADHPGLEPLEPVTWAAGVSGAFRFHPSSDGEAAGLFGQVLPALDAPQWKSLPLLQDGRRIAGIKPFTRVLAEGSSDAGGPASRFPALLVRRYGQGVAGLVNADGLWKWDFYPEARGLGNMYEEFWTQLIQWMASYSEFLPGHDFSLRLPSPRATAGSTVPLNVAWRGSGTAPAPKLVLTAPDGTARDLIPAPSPDAAGRPAWRTSFSPDRPGEWRIRLTDPRPDAPPAPEVICTVPAPPAESDDLSPNPEYLQSITAAAGGSVIAPEQFEAFLRERLETAPPVSRESGAVWRPIWQSWIYAAAITLLLAAEWTARRRCGLS